LPGLDIDSLGDILPKTGQEHLGEDVREHVIQLAPRSGLG
jgi:hypothetical protein